MKKLGGVVFDMDGVVIDSEITHYTAICEAMGEGATASFDQFLEHCTGRDEVYAMTRMAELSGMSFEDSDMAQWSVRKGEAYARLVGEQATPIPGSIELVLSVARELPVGLATGSRRHDVEAALAVLGGGLCRIFFLRSLPPVMWMHPSPIQKPMRKQFRLWVSSHPHAGQLKIRQMGFDRQVQLVCE